MTPWGKVNQRLLGLALVAILVSFGWLTASVIAQKRKPVATQKTATQKAKAKKPAVAAARAPQREEFEGDADKRQDWFTYQRTFPSGQFPPDGRRKAWESRPSESSSRAVQLQMWTPIGPLSTTPSVTAWGVSSGRINAIAVSPANTNLILLGSATGGIWRSTDGGANFAPVSDNQVDLAVGALMFAPSDSNIVYAGMGDPKNNYVGSGVLKSTNAGATWTRVSNNTLPARNQNISLAISPTDPNRLYLADIANDANSTNGVYVSSDGGVNWTLALQGAARGVAHHPTNATTVYAAMNSAVQGGAQPGGIYRSTDSGATWTRVYTSPFTTLSDIRVGVTLANPQVVYTYLGMKNAGDTATLRIEVSTDAGTTFTSRGTPAIDSGQFDYNTYLAVSPTDANTIFIGSRDVWRSTDGGMTFTNLNGNFSAAGVYTPDASNTHPDQQSFAFVPGNANTFYIGNDGGLYRTTNNGANFTSLNSTLSLTQFVGLAIDPTDGARTYGGTQDNGTQKRINTSTPGQWSEFAGGDGGRAVVNPLDPSKVFSTYIYGSITRHDNFGQPNGTEVGSNSTFGEPASGPRIAFYPPFTGNLVNANLYFGTWRLFISTDLGATWTAPGGMTDLTMGGNDTLSAIGVARSNPNVIYTGSRDGSAMRSDNGGTTWTNITTGLPMRSITGITVHPTIPATAYITFSGYGTAHVFKTTNSGTTWTDVNGNLPDIPTQALLFDPLNPNTVYVGTDIGVFRSDTGGTTWNTFNTGLPPVIVTNLVAQAGGRIQIGTYGRGAYELTNDAGCTYTLMPTSQTVVAAGGNGTVTVNTQTGCNWTATSNAAWINITSGSPGTGTGMFNFSATANTGAARSGTITVQGQTFTVNQDASACPTITLAPNTLPAGTVGVVYSATQLSGTGGTAPYTFQAIAGSVPQGMTLTSGGLLSGTPTQALGVNLQIQATDTNGCTGTRTYDLQVTCPTITINPSTLPAGTVGVAYPNTQLTATGGNAPHTFQAIAGSVPPGLTLTTGGLLSGTPTQTFGVNLQIQATDANGCTGTRTYNLQINPAGNGLQFYPLARPVRLLDTRAGQGNCDNVGTPITGGTSITTLARVTCESITIPSTAQAIVGNITVINGSGQSGFLTVYPAGQPLPLAANLIYAPGNILSNAFTVGLSAAGEFNIFGERTIDVVVDISGYYAPPQPAGLYYHPLSKPVRLLDTRAGQGNCDNVGTPITGGTSLTTLARITCEGVTIPAAAQAIVGNATVINGSGQIGYLTIYPNGVPAPLAANIVYFPGQILSNSFTVSLSAAGEFNIFGERTIDMAIDVAGYYSTEANDANGPGLLFNPLSKPVRILDTRAGQGNCDNVNAPIAAGTSIAAPARLTCESVTIPASAQAVIGVVTVVNTTATAGYMTMYPDGVAQPLAANIIYFPGQVISNAFVVGLNSTTGQYRIFGERTIEAIIDVSGYFAQ